MRNKKGSSEVVRTILTKARYEVLPTAKIEAALLESVPRDVMLTVTASPAKGIDSTLDMTERLTSLCYTVVSHLAARMISGPTELAEIVERLNALGLDNV